MKGKNFQQEDIIPQEIRENTMKHKDINRNRKKKI